MHAEFPVAPAPAYKIINGGLKCSEKRVFMPRELRETNPRRAGDPAGDDCVAPID
jgi:hypothetical protein